MSEPYQTIWIKKNGIISWPSWKGGTVALWLVCLTLDQLVWVWSLAGGIVLCSWEGHLTVTVALSTQEYKWVPANLMLWITMWWTGIQGGVGIEILIVASWYRNCDELWPHGLVCRLFYLTSPWVLVPL